MEEIYLGKPDRLTLFVSNHSIQKVMDACGLTNGGKKVFGSLYAYTLDKEPSEEDCKKLIEGTLEIQETSTCYFCNIGKYYGLKEDNITMFSTGERFIYLPEFIETLNKKGYERVK